MTRANYICLTIVFLCIALCLPVWAGPGEIVPFVSLKQEYSDNIAFSGANEKEDFITTGTAGVGISYDTQTVNAKMDGRLFHIMYVDNDQLDSTDGRASATWKCKTTERLGFGASADYRKDSRRDTDTDTTGLVLSGDREKIGAGFSSNYMFSETSQGEIKFEYDSTKIDEVNDDEDDDTFRIDLSFSKNLSQTFDNTRGLLNFSYLHYASDIKTIIPGTTTITYFREFTSDVLQMSAGVSRDITELYNIYFQAGGSYSETTEGLRTKLSGLLNSDVTDPDKDSSTWGGVLSAGLNYDGLYYDIGLSISHDMRASSGTNGAVERSAVSLNLAKKVSSDFSLILDSSCYLNRNDRETRTDLDEFTINVQPGFRYRFRDTFVLSGGYQYTSVKDRQDDTTSERNLVYLLIKKEFDL